MAAAGWYPDPSGAPGLRYWDGTAWGSATQPTPGVGSPDPDVTVAPAADRPADRPAAPPTWNPAPYGQGAPSGRGGRTGPAWGSGQGSWNPGPVPAPASPPPPKGRGRAVALVVGAVVLVAALGVGSFVVVGAVTGGDPDRDSRTAGPGTTDDPTTDSTDDPTDDPTDGPTEDPTDDPTEGVAVGCTSGTPTIDSNRRDGTAYLGGGLVMPAVAGWAADDQSQYRYTFLDGVSSMSRRVDAAATGELWTSEFVLGGLHTSDEVVDLESAARLAVTCLQDGGFYSGYTSSTEVDAVQTTLDGADAFVLTQEIRVATPNLDIEGDIIQVAAVDVGDDESFGLYVSTAPIGGQRYLERQAGQLMALGVE